MKRIGDLLIEAGLINESQLKTALAEQKTWGGRLSNHLVSLKFITEEKLIKFLSQKLKIKYVDISKIKIEPSVVALIPKKISVKYNIFPLGIKTEGGKKILFIATSDPTNPEAIDEIQFLTGHTVRPVLAADQDILNAIEEYYKPDAQQILNERIISLADADIAFEKVTPPNDSPGKNDMIVIHDQPGGVQSEQVSDAELPEEAKAIIRATLGLKTGLSHDLLTALMNKETRVILNRLIELLFDKGIIKEPDIRQRLK
jgi:MshEN domain